MFHEVFIPLDVGLVAVNVVLLTVLVDLSRDKKYERTFREKILRRGVVCEDACPWFRSKGMDMAEQAMYSAIADKPANCFDGMHTRDRRVCRKAFGYELWKYPIRWLLKNCAPPCILKDRDLMTEAIARDYLCMKEVTRFSQSRCSVLP